MWKHHFQGYYPKVTGSVYLSIQKKSCVDISIYAEKLQHTYVNQSGIPL